MLNYQRLKSIIHKYNVYFTKHVYKHIFDAPTILPSSHLFKKQADLAMMHETVLLLASY